jgi:PAS domain S-box-containing protein
MGQNETNAMFVLDASDVGVLGDPRDSMSEVEARLRRSRPSQPVIAWEGDASSFAFHYVSPNVERMLGYPAERWTSEPTFWAEQVVLPADRRDAVAYCAMATANKRDHVFEYRARTADGRILVLRDVVQVIVGPRGIPVRLRGLMFDITAQRGTQMRREELRAAERPPRSAFVAPSGV